MFDAPVQSEYKKHMQDVILLSQARLVQQHLEHFWLSSTNTDVSAGTRTSRAARIAQHWSWLCKHLMRLLSSGEGSVSLLSGDHTGETTVHCYQELFSLVASMNDALRTELSPLHKVRKHMVKCLGQPCTMSSEEGASALEKASG